ncbi:MAG: ABC transporter permease [Thermodesulfobacteriota bacterium]
MKKIVLDIALGILIVFLMTSLLLFLASAPIGATLSNIWQGSFGSKAKFAQVLAVWVPLTLCSCGLLFTFRANLWNIGIEGQIMIGAVCATWALRPATPEQPLLFLCGAVIGAMLGGAGWGLLAGLLKTKGGVHEIFGGLGLNLVAQGLILWLIFGPWKRPGIASMSGTELLPRQLWLPTFDGFRVTPLGLFVTFLAITLTWLILTHSRFGLRLRAIGKNPTGALLFGLVPERSYLAAVIIGGSLAGLAGCLQVIGVYHRLIPAISSGYGYLALLLVMLSGYRVFPVPLLALFFAGLNVGAIQLPIVLQLDSALSGVIQGGSVLAALFVIGIHKARPRWASFLPGIKER